jgi:hypothetical protein
MGGEVENGLSGIRNGIYRRGDYDEFLIAASGAFLIA